MSNMFSKNGFRVSPRKAIDIENIATHFRNTIIKSKVSPNNLAKLLDIFSEIGFCHYDIVEDNSMAQLATMNPQTKLITIQESIFNALCDKTHYRHGMAKFTIAHELGHLLLHRNIVTSRDTNTPIKIYENSEWQADNFAAYFLMPSSEIDIYNDNIDDLVTRFGVSRKAAEIRLEKLRRDSNKKGY